MMAVSTETNLVTRQNRSLPPSPAQTRGRQRPLPSQHSTNEMTNMNQRTGRRRKKRHSEGFLDGICLTPHILFGVLILSIQ